MDSPTINPEQPEFRYHYPESASCGMIAYGERNPVSRSDVKDLGKLYEYTFEAVFTPANDKEN